MVENPHIGESFQRDEGIYESMTATVIKRTLALQIEREIVAQNT